MPVYKVGTTSVVVKDESRLPAEVKAFYFPILDSIVVEFFAAHGETGNFKEITIRYVDSFKASSNLWRWFQQAYLSEDKCVTRLLLGRVISLSGAHTNPEEVEKGVYIITLNVDIYFYMMTERAVIKEKEDYVREIVMSSDEMKKRFEVIKALFMSKDPRLMKVLNADRKSVV